MAYKTRLNAGNGGFTNMMEKGFGIVTVMNAYIYDASKIDFKGNTAYSLASIYGNGDGALAKIDSLKVANVTMEGPSKTVTGGRYSNPLIKFGKSARLEMQDALGRSESLEALCGGIQEWDSSISASNLKGIHFGEDFSGPKMIVGDSFFIDRETGSQVPVKILFYQVLPDSIFNLTQDAEGDATVFDMNGDLLTTEIQVAGGTDGLHGVFYSIVDPKEMKIAFNFVNKTADSISVTTEIPEGKIQYSVNGGVDFTDEAPASSVAPRGTTVYVHVVVKGKVVASAYFVVE